MVAERPLRLLRPTLQPVLLLIGVLLLGLTVWQLREPPGVDFHTYEAAARVGVTQGWSHIYDQGTVATAQRQIAPGQVAQPFLSPPPVAWLAALLVPLPYMWAYLAWAGVMLLGMVLALAWSSQRRGTSRWVIALAAVTCTWVVHAAHVGQVVVLVAISVAVGWRLLREDRDLAAGAVLSLILLKPNTAILVPLGLLVARRYRAVAGLAAAAGVLLAIEVLTAGPQGLAVYAAQLTGELPVGADALTLKGAFNIDGAAAFGLRVGIVGVTAAAAWRLRERPARLLAATTVASLLIAPYLHASDLCVLVVAAWLVWEDRPSLRWRLALGAGWAVAAPLSALATVWPLSRWPLAELGILVAVVVGGG